MKRRVLHITPWYPTEELPGNAIWIQRHIECLAPYVDQHVVHIEVEFGPWRFKRRHTDGYSGYLVQFPFRNWRLREWLSAFLLWGYCLSHGAGRKYDVINFHIAYPLTLWAHRFRSVLPRRWIITEHWSYYHFHFHSNQKLTRIKRVFHRGIPLITVSQALAHDIEHFAHTTLNYSVVPNAVDSLFFNRDPACLPGDHFFMAAFWKKPKDPFAVLHAIHVLGEKGLAIHLRIGGWGPLLEQMKDQVKTLGIGDRVTFLGKLSQQEMATEFNSARAFILPSAYETFSVVSAESLCCGCPVLTETLGALPELVTPGNGLTREVNESWSSLMERFLVHAPFDRNAIATHALTRFEKEKVGAEYAEIIQKLP